MTQYLARKSQEVMTELATESETSCESWTTVCEVTLAQVIMFNRRRVGEVSKMMISDYENATVGDIHSDIMQHLSELEKRLCNLLTRVQVVGKRGTHVPVLLTDNFNKALQVIVSKRAANGVPDFNQFVFARSGSDKHLRGSDVLRKYAVECDVKYPDTT